MVQEQDKKPPEHAPKPHESVPGQFFGSALGEVVAFSVAIGAVYATEKLLPKQTAAFVSGLAEKLGKWRGTSAETQGELAKKIVDVGIMNMAGASGIAVQYAHRRLHQTKEERTPLWYEAGRLATGRIVGTATAIGALAFMNIQAPGAVRKMESGISNRLGTTMQSDRFAELFISDAIQSVGAVAGNAPAQLLYDRLVNVPEKSISK